MSLDGNSQSLPMCVLLYTTVPGTGVRARGSSFKAIPVVFSPLFQVVSLSIPM
jgi:hypothetical protein